MAEFAAPSFDDLPVAYPPDELLWAMLEVSLTGMALYSPIRDAGGVIVDFTIDLLNPAAQRILKQPARPGGTYLHYYPHTLETGVFAFHRDTFEAGGPARLDVNYQGDSLDNYFRLSACRVGQGLLVSFTDTADESRSAVEVALRQSQVSERAARAEAESQRQQLYSLLQQAPVAFAYLEGPEHIITLANPLVCRLWDRQPEEVIGLPLLVALPEIQGQGFDQLLAEVLRTAQPFHGTEVPAVLKRQGQLETAYVTFTYQPQRSDDGTVTGIVVVAIEVTEQVRARQLVEEQARQTNQLNEELAAANEELQAANEEIRASTDELLVAQHELRQLNEVLEARVAKRTQALVEALEETQRQREQVAVQENRLQQILRQVPAAVATLAGPHHHYTFFNTSFQALTGHRPRLGAALGEVLPELLEQSMGELLDQVYASGEPVSGAERPLWLQNAAEAEPEQRYVDFSFQPLLDAQQQTTGILIFIVDTTDKVHNRQQAQAAQAEATAAAERLAAQRQAFYHVFEQTSALIFIARGAQHFIEYVNPAYQELFPDRVLMGRATAEAIPAAVTGGFITLLDQVYQTGSPYFGNEVPVVVYDAEGRPSTRYLNFTYQADRENGEIVGVSSFAFDISEQVVARRQQLEQQAQLADLFAQAPVAIAIMRGAHYVIEVANPLMAQIWGRTPAQVVGRELLEVLPEVRDQGFMELLDQVMATGEAFVAQEVSALLEREGSLKQVYLNFVYQPLRDAQGLITSVAVVATEVSEQVAARQQVSLSNQRLTAANEQLIRTNADLDNFIYIASHDLREPIGNIEGLVTALREELDQVADLTNITPLLTMMQRAIERFQRTIGDLTEVTKLQKAYEQPGAAAIDLAALVEAVRLDLQPQLVATAGKLSVDVAACPRVAFSEKNLRSVIYNLLSNAFKYRHPHRRPLVRLRSYAAGAYSVIEVQDNGLGLDENQQRQLFGLFQRLHSHVEGTGIGLYMVKKILDNAGGRIEVASQLGVGSTFRLYFP
ncbi:PAS domain-containing protein [Hymenobacter baengnokdamensis]|uniref:PAS domain-containing protein n=1 Tax=Hymenobacter baengnokdamensis TaxID=2615203 RepID=UPI00177ABB73|nr:PAS domain-containing protein [Hymenobacter baengnokdamensis]